MSSDTPKSIRILIIDDHAIMRTTLRMFLERQSGFLVVGEGASPEEALAATARERPDIILLDLHLGDANGLDLLPQLHTVSPDTQIVVLTDVRDVEMHRRAIRLGALGLVLKEEAVTVLLEAIAKVSAGEIWLNRLLVARVLSEMTRPGPGTSIDPETRKINTLTARERELIPLIGQGLKNQSIADRLCISEATVRHHLTSIFAKLGLEDRFALAIYAYRHGLACFPPQACTP
jgi:DNA-binding NarL/FixJ family response regulator